ncbi:MAG TPA: hypothetical protein VFG04_04185 [Planctomycetaceae bacterium]|jgi:hypothetical protein|nr:hypothetical protein [Planctomycetaceae bacterium]
MSDEAKKRSRRWIGWAAIAVLVLYPPSFIPACIVADWCRHQGIEIGPLFDIVYAPVIWLLATFRPQI